MRNANHVAMATKICHITRIKLSYLKLPGKLAYKICKLRYHGKSIKFWCALNRKSLIYTCINMHIYRVLIFQADSESLI